MAKLVYGQIKSQPAPMFQIPITIPIVFTRFFAEKNSKCVVGGPDEKKD
jgi:hypothetical protein